MVLKKGRDTFIHKERERERERERESVCVYRLRSDNEIWPKPLG